MTGKDIAPARGPQFRGAEGHSAQAVGAAAPTARALQWIETLDDLLALETDWLALERLSAAPHNFFQSFAWCSTWAKVYLAGMPTMALKTMVAREDGAVVMIWPLMVVRHGPVTVLKWLSDPVGQYGDVLLDHGADAGRWFTLAWERITNDPDIDGVALKHVREDARAYEFLSGNCSALAQQHMAPRLNLSPFTSADELSGALSRDQRAQRSKLRKQLGKDGHVTFGVHRGGDPFRDAVHDALAFKKAWCDERGLKADVIGDSRFERLLTELGAVDETAVAAGVLSIDGAPLSVDVAFTYKGRYFGCVIAENGTATAKSPTKVHLDLRQKECVAQGYTEFDLMPPASPFKAHWSDGAVAVKDFVQPLNLWGLAYCSIYLAHLRPALKQLCSSIGTGPSIAVSRALSCLRVAR